MPRLLCLFLIASALCAVDAARAAEPSPLPDHVDLYAGDTRVLDASTARVAVGNGDVLSVNTLGHDQLLLLAGHEGATTVDLWLRDGRRHRLTVTVTEANLDVVLAQVRAMLDGAANVTARIAGARIVLEGERVSDADQRRVAAIAELYPALILNFVGRVGWELMLHFDVRIVEVRRTAVRELGIRWDTQANGPAVGVIADFASNDLFRVLPPAAAVPGLDALPLPARVSPAATYAGITSVLGSRIALLEQRGDAFVLAQPTLSCRSGGSARFVSGGEFPIPVTDGLGSTNVEFKEYGVILDVKPVADRSGSVYAQVETELSQIDESVRVLGVPGLLKRKTSAEINVREGEVVVLSGLANRSRSRDSARVPGLGSLPVLGGLFRSTQRRTLDSELLVLITPRVIRTEPDAAALATDPNASGVARAGELQQRGGVADGAGRLRVLD